MTTRITVDPETGTHALTDAQIRALEVLAEWGSARVSNRTTRIACGAVYWQTADTLQRELLAVRSVGLGGETVELTDAGRRACKHLGIGS